MANYVGTRHAVGVGNGYDALFLIFKSLIQLNILKPNDEVAVASNTYIATIYAIINAGLKPVLIEPDENYNIDLNRIGSIKAVCVVHLYGLPCWGNLEGKIVVEDVAQALGGEYQGRKVGGLGIAAAHSFYPTKNLGCLGDGGAITTNDKDIADTVRMLGNYGSKVKGVNPLVGVNSRLDEIQASILLTKFKSIDKGIKIRRRIADIYATITNDFVKLPINIKNHTWHVYPIMVKNRDELRYYLLRNGIETVVHYPLAPSEQIPLKQSQPISERMAKEELSLPINITVKQAYKIKQLLERWKPLDAE